MAGVAVIWHVHSFVSAKASTCLDTSVLLVKTYHMQTLLPMHALSFMLWTSSHFSFVWTMCIWKCRCVQHSEPALLVGDTGTGKTTVCQMVALMRGQKLHIINCNQHTETSDFLGGFRPVRSVVWPCHLP